MAVFEECTHETESLLQYGGTLKHISPTPLSITTMTLEMVVSAHPNLQAVSSALARECDLSKAGMGMVHFRGKGISRPRKYPHVRERGTAFGDASLSLEIIADEGEMPGVWPWQRPVCHAKLFNSGHVKLMGCTSYRMANVAAKHLLQLLHDTCTGPVRVLSSGTHLINGVFAMAPFSPEQPISKVDLNNMARQAGFHLHSAASGGKPYVKFVLEHGNKALVYVSGKVWITGCRSVAELCAAARRVQGFIDEHAEALLLDDSFIGAEHTA